MTVWTQEDIEDVKNRAYKSLMKEIYGDKPAKIVDVDAPSEEGYKDE